MVMKLNRSTFEKLIAEDIASACGVG